MVFLYAIVWLLVVPIRLWWRWVVIPSHNWMSRLLQPRVLVASDLVSQRLNLARTILVALGASLAELQWRWGTADFGASLGDWFEGFFTGPVALGVSVLVFALVFPACARRGDRLQMVKRMAVPVLVVLGSAAILATLPLVAAGFNWLQSARTSSMAWASDGLYGALMVLAGVVLFATLLYFPPVLVIGAWLASRGSFRAGDAHPLMPAASSILAGALLAIGPVSDVMRGAQVEPDFPIWAAIGLAVVVPVVTVVLALVQLVRLITVGGWNWRSLYQPVPTR